MNTQNVKIIALTKQEIRFVLLRDFSINNLYALIV